MRVDVADEPRRNARFSTQCQEQREMLQRDRDRRGALYLPRQAQPLASSLTRAIQISRGNAIRSNVSVARANNDAFFPRKWISNASPARRSACST